MKKTILILILLLGSMQAESQTDDYLPKVVPPAPTSSVFRQYGEYQPSLATGMINIPISLFEIKDGDFSLPFNLIYSTSGIKASDIPTPAGYGWLLSPGLRVSRTVLGRADDYFPLKQGSLEDSFGVLKNGVLSENDSYNLEHGTSKSALYDSQQDVFTIHLPNGNYTFFIENINNAYNIKTVGNLLKIEPLYTPGNSSLRRIYGFKITDENGVIYNFGKETDDGYINAYTEVPSDGFVTSWMLREIKLPNNSIISFIWDKAWISDFTQQLIYGSATVKDNINLVLLNSKMNDNQKSQPQIQESMSQTYSNPYPFTSTLTKIIFSAGVIDFNYKDSSNKQFLSTIKMKNNNGTIIKNIDFFYGKERTFAARLLTGLKIDKEVYKFTYNPQTYPQNTTGIDYWGFYNGKESNPSLIPRIRLNMYNIYSGVNPDDRTFPEWIGEANRSVSPEHMKAFMLTRIDYPAGGYSEFEYEPHKFTNKLPISTIAFADGFADPINEGGGLRVTKITSQSDPNATPVVKIYKYGENESGLANITYVPTLDTFIEEICMFEPIIIDYALSQNIQMPFYGSQVYRYLQINQNSDYSKYLINQSPIWYSKVTEYVNTHKTEFFYAYNNDEMGLTRQYKRVAKLYTSLYHSLFQNGPRMLEQLKYLEKNGVYTPIERTTFNYMPVFNGSVDNAMIIRGRIISGNVNEFLQGWGKSPDFFLEESPVVSPYPGHSNPELAAHYKTLPYSIDLTYYEMKSKQTELFSNDTSVVKEEYTYKMPGLPKEITTSTSESNTSIVTTMKYPGDYPSSPYNAMVSKNILTPVIEKTSYVKDKLTGSLEELNKVQTNYTLFNNSIYKPASIQTSSRGGNLETEATFNNYDTKGNLKLMTTRDERKVYYLWSYNGQYPIAEINNVSNLESTESAIKEVFGNISNINAITDKTYLNYSDTVCLRNLRNHNTLKPFFINSYVYNPLVGVTSITNQSGLTTTYNYDDVGRLISIIDGNNKTLSSYSYQYKGPTFSDISLSFPAESSYDITSNPNLNKTFTAITSGGSGQGFTYKWIHQLPTGGTSTATGNPASFYLNSLGTNTLTCTVEDMLSGKTKEFSKSFKVSEATSFKNIQISNSSGSWTRTANANIYCENDGVITFNIYCSKSNPDTRMYIKLGYNDLIEVTDYTYSSTVRVNFSAGTTYVNLTIEGDDPSATIELQMTSITNNSLGGTTNLWITPN